MSNKDIIDTARDRMSETVRADEENRRDGLDDLKFLTGKYQWPEEIRREREADNKPCLTVNILPEKVRQVTGDIRKMNPAINIMPASDEASKETAEVIEGLVRHIEYRSDASSVYERTAESAAQGSIGWFRVLNDWEDDTGFNQEVKIKAIRNAFSVYCDPAAEEPTRSDAEFLFITETMRMEDFKADYPKAKTVDVEHDADTDALEHWHAEGKVVVAEYFWKEYDEVKIGLTATGEVVKDPQVPENIVRTRKAKVCKVMWAKISGHEVLEGPIEQPCKTIPVIAVTGEELHVGEEVFRSSVIRHAKEPQQLYNYHSSADAEFVALQPKAPYIGTLKQFLGLEKFWNNANTKNHPYLPYNPDEKAPGAPQRQQPPVSSQGIMNSAMKAREDMKATTGIYDAALGAQSNETSGVAIRQRQIESDVATSIYSDNMAKAIAQCGRVILEMIPRIYDTQRVIRILGKDDQQQMVQINGVGMSENGPVPINDLTIGKYDVRVSVGPNYTTLRQETAEGMMNFVKAYPPAANVTADLIAKSMDWPNADKFAERLKKTLPPGIADQEDGQEVDPAALMAEMAQMGEAMQEMQQMLQSPDFAKAQAEAAEAGADAEKASLEVEEKELELAAKSGELNEAIELIVQKQVARALQGALGA